MCLRKKNRPDFIAICLTTLSFTVKMHLLYDKVYQTSAGNFVVKIGYKKLQTPNVIVFKVWHRKGQFPNSHILQFDTDLVWSMRCSLPIPINATLACWVSSSLVLTNSADLQGSSLKSLLILASGAWSSSMSKEELAWCSGAGYRCSYTLCDLPLWKWFDPTPMCVQLTAKNNSLSHSGLTRK